MLHTKNSSKAAFDQKKKEMEEKKAENGPNKMNTGNMCQDKEMDCSRRLSSDSEDKLGAVNSENRLGAMNSEDTMETVDSSDRNCGSGDVTLTCRDITETDDSSFKEGMS